MPPMHPLSPFSVLTSEAEAPGTEAGAARDGERQRSMRSRRGAKVRLERVRAQSAPPCPRQWDQEAANMF